MAVKIAPSLASAPLDNLGEVVRLLEQGGADYLHFDVEDGVFTPVMTLGVKIIKDLRPLSRLPFDVHLMMVNPEWILPGLVDAGADRIAVHWEACPYPRRVLRKIVELGAKAGLAFNPKTPLPDLAYLAQYLSYVILLTTEPEDGDCPYLPEVLDKLRAGKTSGEFPGIEWVVDGGVSAINIAEIVQAGAETVVAGRGVFGGGAIVENLHALRNASSI